MVKFIDVETTGLEVGSADRIISIAALDLETEASFFSYVNPDGKTSHPRALEIHKLTPEFLEDKPKFAQVADSFLQFIGEEALIAHNAPFDICAINTELKRISYPILTNATLDTIDLSRQKLPLASHSLDTLINYFEIDSSSRQERHGALDDCRLLKLVFQKLFSLKNARLRLDSFRLAS